MVWGHFVRMNRLHYKVILVQRKLELTWQKCLFLFIYFSLFTSFKTLENLHVRFPKFCNSWIKIRTPHFLWSNLYVLLGYYIIVSIHYTLYFAPFDMANSDAGLDRNMLYFFLRNCCFLHQIYYGEQFVKHRFLCGLHKVCRHIMAWSDSLCGLHKVCRHIMARSDLFICPPKSNAWHVV